MKKIIYTLIVIGLSSNCLAQKTTVYKCTDANGLVSYMNVAMSNKNQTCQKTDLDDPDKSGMVIRGDKLASVLKTSVSPSSATINNDEQKKRDEGRNGILSKELQDEETQLVSVKQMLKNVENSKDTDQVNQLKNMENTHNKNISALKKELGIKEEMTLSPRVVNN